MNLWAVGLASLGIGLFGAFTARDRSIPGRRTVALIGWLPFAIWTLTLLIRAWRHP